MAVALPFIAAAGAIFSGISAYGQAQYQSKVAQRNAEIAGQNANLATQQAQVDQQRQDREMASLQGQQTVAAAANGLDVLGASQIATRATTRRARNEGAVDIRRQGEAQTASFFNQQAGLKGDAGAYHMQGVSSLVSSVFNAAGAYVGAGGSSQSLTGSAVSRRSGKFVK